MNATPLSTSITPPPRDIMKDFVAVSSPHRRFSLIERMEPGSPLYHIVYLVPLRGLIDETALKRAFATIVQRHAALRTNFVATNSELVQVLNTATTFTLPVVDLTAVPVAERAAELKKRATEEAKKPFDLQRDLMLRARLFKLADTEHALMLLMHHIAADSWSIPILYRELGPCYAAFANSAVPKLTELPTQ